jgi:hypothetical protein
MVAISHAQAIGDRNRTRLMTAFSLPIFGGYAITCSQLNFSKPKAANQKESQT